MNKLKKYRITKYNPMNRDEQGSYTQNEWTEFNQIGKVFNSKIFTFDEYINIENKYIDVVLYRIKELKIERLTLIGLNIYSTYDNNVYFDPELIQVINELDLFNGTICIRIDELPNYLKLNFRDVINFDIVIDKTNIITFGYDFYMYYHTKITENEFNHINKFIHNIGLFVD